MTEENILLFSNVNILTNMIEDMKVKKKKISHRDFFYFSYKHRWQKHIFIM